MLNLVSNAALPISQVIILPNVYTKNVDLLQIRGAIMQQRH